jgi:hypothetical protein
MALNANQEIARDIIVAFCNQFREISHYDLIRTDQNGAASIGKALGELYNNVLEIIDK